MMVDIDLSGDGVWPDLDVAQALHGTLTAVSSLEQGTTGGRPTVALRIKLDDGREVVAETTVRLFQTIAGALRGKFGIVE